MSTISTGQAGGGRVAATSTLRFALLITGTSGFLDAYTYVERGGVFANAQTANVVLGAVAVSDEHWVQALQHLASIVTFAVGAAVATHLATRQRPRFAPTVEVLATGLLAVTVVVAAFVPASAPPMVVTVPLVFLAAMLTELFRKAGDLPYLPIATTGSLARWVESTHEQVTHPTSSSRRRFRVYLGLVGAFVLGALVGALATEAVGVHASPVAALPMALAMYLALRGR
ncbi:MAG TPA: YoaK family protein [Nocardioides sp.]|nr:YoaK family protein [Nocardioides sp.]